MPGRGSYNGGSTIIKVNATFGAGKYQEKKWPKVLKITALKGKAIRQKRRKILVNKATNVEKTLEKLKLQKSQTLSRAEKMKIEEKIQLKLKDLCHILIEKENMGTI